MHGDHEQREVNDQLATALYTADPASFVAHGCSIALLCAAYVFGSEPPPLAIFCVVFYAIANGTAIALWIGRRHHVVTFSARRWIVLHASRNAALHFAPGVSVWLAFQSQSADLIAAHVVSLVVLAALAYGANSLSLLNLATTLPVLLLPTSALYLMQPGHRGVALGAALVMFVVLMLWLGVPARRLFRRNVDQRTEQQRLIETIARQKHMIEKSCLAKTRFFATASHDLRQPLHAIGLLAHALTDRSASLQQRDETAQHIISNVEALNQLFNEVLDLARIESGTTRVMARHVRVAELLTRIDKQFRPTAAAKGLALRIAPTECVAFTDPVLLERVLANLVSNAVRYTDHGSIWIGVRHACDPVRCVIEVRDSGIGIARHEHAHVFEDFYQVPLPNVPVRAGHGLGLATVLRLTRLLGGEPELRSELGRGTTICVPLKLGDATLIGSNADTLLPVDAFIEGRRVLCIDDEPANLDALGILLTRWGCIVRGCRDELAAVRAIAEGFVPDAVLFDYRIDRHQAGVEALKAVREALRRRGHNEFASVMITGDTSSPELAALCADGVPVLQKPVTPTRLRRTLDTLLQPTGQPEAA